MAGRALREPAGRATPRAAEEASRPFGDHHARKEVIGRATLYLGDCRDILPTLGKVDAVVTDPPYGIGWEYEGYSDTFENWRDLMDATIPMMREKANNISISVGPMEAEKHILVNHDPRWRACWYRGSTGARSPMGFRDWETIFLWGTPPVPMHDYFSVPPEKEILGHSCPKPLGYAKWLVHRLTLSCTTILDPFMGSGTTGVAAVQMQRDFIGIEREPAYFDIACRRIEDAQRQGSLFDSEAA